MSELKLTADSGGGTVSLKGPATTTGNAALPFVLPVADGSAGQFIKTDGSKNLSFSGGGKILQVVSANLKTAASGTNDTSYVTTGLTATITPSATSSKVLVIVQLTAAVTKGGWCGFRLYRGGSCVTDAISTVNTNTTYAQIDGHYINNNWLQTGYQSDVANDEDEFRQTHGTYLDSPSTTSSTAYDVRVCSRTSSYTWYVNRTLTAPSYNHVQGGMSTITLMEVSG